MWLKSYTNLTYNLFCGLEVPLKDPPEDKILATDKMYRKKFNLVKNQ